MAHEQRTFGTRDAFRKWLVKNHGENPGIWLVLGKNSEVKTITAQEALEEALCFGWIDGQLQSIDANQYLKKFTPRRKGSVWSERNRKLAEGLIQSGRMTEAGHAAIAQARELGTWEHPRQAPISEAQIAVVAAALAGSAKALANFRAMSPSVQRTYTAVYLAVKKEETRKKRLAWLIERLEANKKPME